MKTREGSTGLTFPCKNDIMKDDALKLPDIQNSQQLFIPTVLIGVAGYWVLLEVHKSLSE